MVAEKPSMSGGARALDSESRPATSKRDY